MKILSAFLYGYLYSDILTGDQVTHQLYIAHVVMLYTVLCSVQSIRSTQSQCTYIYALSLYMYTLLLYSVTVHTVITAQLYTVLTQYHAV